MNSADNQLLVFFKTHFVLKNKLLLLITTTYKYPFQTGYLGNYPAWFSVRTIIFDFASLA